LSAVLGTAQTRFLAPSVDPEGDSLTIIRVRAKMDSIRQTCHRPTVAVVLGGGPMKIGAQWCDMTGFSVALSIGFDL